MEKEISKRWNKRTSEKDKKQRGICLQAHKPRAGNANSKIDN